MWGPAFVWFNEFGHGEYHDSTRRRSDMLGFPWQYSDRLGSRRRARENANVEICGDYCNLEAKTIKDMDKR